ncbi:radical SAM protein [Methyloterricola oryzae]|uniref:radical SAM protein n=1 Tax=Methyloterricola oryzae TaxID=1495050 RepID=UPI0005EB0159|nr:radical SAM protein [Methyloterricola oryzae]
MKRESGLPAKAIPLSQRGEIRLGFRCNARCGFCYYQDLLDNPVELEPTYQALRGQLAALRGLGASEVEFTGGEPTIRGDLLDLVKYARELGFSNISLITNGLRLANAGYAARLAQAGVNDVLFSLHGPDDAIHDQHTAIPGSFSKILQAFAHMRELGVRCRITTTVTGLNVGHVPAIFGLALGLGAQCIHMAVFSPVAEAGNTDPRFFVDYEQAAAAIKEAIDRFKPRLPPVSVKYLPFCFMQGYEEYVMNLYQQSYDPDDWNYYFSNRVRRAGSSLKGLAFDVICAGGFLLAKEWSVPWRNGWLGIKVAGLTRWVELLRKTRLPACRQCRYETVCDFGWKTYVQRFGSAGFHAVPGDKLKHPAWAYVMSRYRQPGARLSAHAASEGAHTA